MVRSDVALLDAPRMGVAEALSQLDRGDVVIVASCAPYTRSVAEVARVAASNGQTVIAITDSRSSPLVPPAEHAFFIPHTSSFYSNSMAPMSSSVKRCSTLSPGNWVTRRSNPWRGASG
jgi:DNA-binding MurR/RpiR family transcriptional regulator